MKEGCLIRLYLNITTMNFNKFTIIVIVVVCVMVNQNSNGKFDRFHIVLKKTIKSNLITFKIDRAINTNFYYELGKHGLFKTYEYEIMIKET